MFSTSPNTLPKTSLPHRRSPSAAFTVVELLVVVTIIAVLMTLTIRVVGSFLGQARASATETTIRKIQSLLNARVEALHRMTKRPGFLETTPDYNSTEVINLANGDPNLRKILTTKQVTRRLFPQRFAEVDSTLQPALFQNGAASSSEILYDFLTQSNVLGDTPLGADAFSTTEATDKNGNGLPEFLDAWGNPLRFYRWPTRLFRSPTPPFGTSGYWSSQTNVIPVDPTFAKRLLTGLPGFSGNLQSDLARDPDDPLRRCAAFNPYRPGSDAPFDNDFETVGSLYHTPGTFHVLLVISAGPDGILGLFEPDDIGNKGYLAAVDSANQDGLDDNITYLNVRAGGK
ncbi:MAG: hypothetical protein ACKV0T_00015 [Planctomycetales bacterium]